MARKPFVGGNWKMNLHASDAVELAKGLVQRFDAADKVDAVICPAFPYLAAVGEVVKDSRIKLGAQDVYHEANGAFTGEVSLSMLQDLGVEVVLTGHSERRQVIGESDVLINAKTKSALDAGLEVILCVGEKIEQREAGQTHQINMGQLAYGLAGVTAEQMSRVTIAYEPVWAIGTGKTADSAVPELGVRLGRRGGQGGADSVRRVGEAGQCGGVVCATGHRRGADRWGVSEGG